MDPFKIQVGLTTSAIALGCVGITYLVMKYKYAPQDAAEALKYLTIVTVTTEKHCDQVVEDLRRRCSKHRAVGFDCEWVTEEGKRQPVALIQISTFDGFCCLFRLSHLKTVPSSLKDLLEDKTIHKVGVAPIDDAKYLSNDYFVGLNSTLDLRFIAQVCGYNPGGLASLSKTILGIVLDKSWRVRCSNWAGDTLSERQTKYAAADAHIAIKIFIKLVTELKSTSFFRRFYRNKNFLGYNIDEMLLQYSDIHFKAPIQNSKKSKAAKPDKASKRYVHATRSKPLYHNCFLEAPDGELLCTCDNKKALWYVDKELADIVKEDPLTVRLRFEPAGRSVGDVGKYYQLKKDNRCVVCGASDSYIRKNVVPREYRKYFPELMKDHSSHDVLLLCVECHKRSNMLDQAVRARLAALCDAPLSCDGNNCKYIEDADFKKVKSAARALLYQSRALPDARRSELERVVLRNYPHHEHITPELLEQAANVRVVYENEEYESHGDKVVEHFLSRSSLLRLEELWREHFLATMRPRYMPPLWSVKHSEQRLRVRLNEGRLSEEDVKLLGM